MRTNDESTDIKEKLLSYLISELENPHITFTSPPIPLTGGFDTAIYRFQIGGAQEMLSHPLVLRVFTRDPNLDRALFESVVQNALVGSGYSAPKVFFTSNDRDVFGGSFMIMEFIAGHPMIEEPEETIPKMLAKAHHQLHDIDIGPIRETIEAAGIEEKFISFTWRLRWLEDRARARPSSVETVTSSPERTIPGWPSPGLRPAP